VLLAVDPADASDAPSFFGDALFGAASWDEDPDPLAPSAPEPPPLSASDPPAPLAPADDFVRLAFRSLFAQPDPLKWIVGATNALDTGLRPQDGHASGPSAWTPWITSKRWAQAAQR